MTKKLIKAIISLSAGLTAISAHAGDKPSMVVELFTSQGCSSCPPANEFVGSLSDDPDKLVLSYGVTYWDFLGWKDTFGDPEYTVRQKEYDAALGVGFVYTPQIVVNGTEHDSQYVRPRLEKAQKISPGSFNVDISAKDGYVSIASNAKRVYVVSYTHGWQNVAVKRGENSGRTLRVANVVDDLEVIKEFGKTDIMIEPGKSYAALVHDNENHSIVAASVLRP